MNNDLILQNIKLVDYTIKKMGLIYNYEDYYDAGVYALINAGRTFDDKKGYKFTNYAITSIKNEILKCIEAEKTDKRKANYKIVSLNNNINSEKNNSFIELLVSNENIEEIFLQKEKVYLLKTIICILEPQDKFMLEHYFELWGNKKMSQTEIAKILNVKQSYVSHRIKRAMRIIKKIMEDKYENN